MLHIAREKVVLFSQELEVTQLVPSLYVSKRVCIVEVDGIYILFSVVRRFIGGGVFLNRNATDKSAHYRERTLYQ